jgi:hypothetical protein
MDNLSQSEYPVLVKTAGKEAEATPSTSRRKVLKKLGAGLLAASGATAGAASDNLEAQAKVTDSITTIGAVILPGKMSAPGGTPPAGQSYGLVASSDATINLATLPASSTGAVIRGGTSGLVVSGTSYGIDASSQSGIGVKTNTTGSGSALNATSQAGPGIVARGATFGLDATSTAAGSAAVNATSANGIGVQATGNTFGIKAASSAGVGLAASGASFGLTGDSTSGIGLQGSSASGVGIVARSTANSPLKLEPKTSPGAPTSGLHKQGEIWLDSLGDLYLCKTDGTPGTWLKVNDRVATTRSDRFDNVKTINVKDFGAVGNGVADDTDAIQAAINQFSGNDITHTDPRTGSIYFPPGDYKITRTLRYIGNPGVGLRLYGDIERDRAGSGSGIWLLWDGAADGTMFKFEGANGTTIEKMNFNGQNKCKRVLWFDCFGDPDVPGSHYAASSGIVMRACFIANSAGSGSSLLTLGHEDGRGIQVSEVFLEDCYLSGNGETDPLKMTEAGFKTLSGGNTKNFFLYGCIFTSCIYNVDCTKDSGPLLISGGVASSDTGITFRLGDGGTILDGIEVESGGIGCTFLTSGFGSGVSTVIIRNCDVTSNCKEDDKLIYCPTTLMLEGNKFVNRRTTSSIPKIYCNNIYSVGNWFFNVTDHAPFFDTNLNNTLGGPGDTYYKLFTGDQDRIGANVTSINDRGNTLTNFTGIPLRQTTTSPISVVQLQPYGLDEGNAMSGEVDGNSGFNALNIGEQRLSSQRITIDYRRWKASAAFQVVQLFELPVHAKLIDLVADTTTAYSGVPGSLELRVGITNTNPGGEELLLAHDVKSGPVVKGNAEADLGPKLQAANRVQGSFSGNWSNKTYIFVSLNSGNGTLNVLTAGSTTFYATYLRYP